MHQLAAQLATLQLYETSFKNSYVCFPVPANITGSFCAHTDKVNCAKISISGQYFVTGGDDAKASLWRANTLDLALAVPGTSPVTSVAIDDEEQIIAVGGESGAVKFVRIGTQKMHRFNGHRAKVTCLEFHSTGDHLVSGSIDGTVKV
jgi:centriolar protein POC1